MKIFVLSLIMISINGFAAGSQRYSHIDSPVDNENIDPARPIPVRGSGKGPFEGAPAIMSQPVLLNTSGHGLEQDRTAIELGRKVLAMMETIRNPEAANAMQTVTDLGQDQRYYVMVRGWLQYQLDGDKSILGAAGVQARSDVKKRVRFLENAIRAIDLD